MEVVLERERGILETAFCRISWANRIQERGGLYRGGKEEEEEKGRVEW